MSWALWITGLPGSGKSVIARALARELQARGEPVMVLELDRVRKVVTPVPTYQARERDLVYRALVYLAALLTESGIPILIDATAHRRAWRDLARAVIPNFGEIQLTCPLEVCQERERGRETSASPRGIYTASRRPGATVPGVNVEYESALAPEVTIDTSKDDVAAAVEKIVPIARELGSAALRADGRLDERWAIWITGLPGSGKTTLASTVAESLAARGVAVRVLDLADLRQFILAGGAATAEDEEIAHRMLACAASFLTDAGVPVIIDATGPRRAWRELARELIGHFAEVQLLCPPEVCGDRERAVRWNLGFCAQAPRCKTAATEGPDVAPDYEHSLNPDVTIRTDVVDVGNAAREVLRLTERLQRAAASTARTDEGRRPPCRYVI